MTLGAAAQASFDAMRVMVLIALGAAAFAAAVDNRKRYSPAQRASFASMLGRLLLCYVPLHAGAIVASTELAHLVWHASPLPAAEGGGA